MGGISNELGGRALSTVDPGPSLGSEDRCRVSHVSRNDTRLAGYATEPSASRARECGSAQGSREKRLHSQNRQMPSHLDFIDQWGSFILAVRNSSCKQSSERVCHPENDRRRLGPPNCHRTKRHRGAMTATGAELDDGFQLGDAIRWLIFLVPWSAFSLYCLLALSAQLGPLGIVEAVALSLVSLPFWRRVCCRPVYLPYTALLRRHLAKSADSAGFEDTSAAGVTANPGLAWVKTVEERTESMQEELGAFLRSTACRTPEDDFAESDDNAAADDDAWRLDRLSGDGADSEGTATTGTGTGTGTTTRRRMTRSASFGRRNARPSRRLVRAGWSSLPLCDDTLVEPNAMAKRHFPKTIRAIAAVGGFQARLWVLSPDESPPRVARGVSDGYWRTHVILAADDDMHLVDGGGEGPNFVLAGIQVGGERVGIDVGATHVVNDHRGRFFYNRLGGDGEKGDSGPGAVVLTFDVCTPEMCSSRDAMIKHRSEMIAELGEVGGSAMGPDGGFEWRRAWAYFRLTLLANLG